MKPRFFLLTVSLVAVFLAVSCAPAAPTALPVTNNPATATPAPQTAPTEAAVAAPTEVAPVQAVATSRGPNLEATDPNTVNLASGQLQLVEFFRFT